MSWSFKVARIAGTEIRIHGTFLLLLAWYAFVYYDSGGVEEMFWGSFFILLLFACVLLHELGHATAARHYGIRTPDITLLPIGGMARLERLPDKPVQEIVVALAGPAVNAIIAAVLFLVMHGTLATPDFLRPDMVSGSLIFKLFAANIILVLFNLIPAFPMDGGRVLRATLAIYMDRARATVIAARVGQGIAVPLGVFSLFTSQPILFLIAIFVFMAARQEMQYTVLKQAAENLCVGQAMITRFLALPFDISVGAAAEEIAKDSSHEYPLVDGQLHLRGMVFRQQILEAARTSPSRAALEVGFHPPAVRMETPFPEVLELMQCHQVAVLPVINPERQIVGMVSLARLSALADAGSSTVSHRNVKNS